VDLFLAGCQGLGLALAAGVLGGAISGTRDDDPLRVALALTALAAGAVLFGWSLTDEDHAAWPGWVAGALAALGAFGVANQVVSGARRRAGEEGSGGAIATMCAAAGLTLGGLSLLVSPVSLLALASLTWLAFARRRRAAVKHEGLRVLR
jgi:hypothetical protein